MVDIKFVDTFGTWQHFSCPIRELTEEVFEEGYGFDGSSIRGWKSIEASDMLAMPAGARWVDSQPAKLPRSCAAAAASSRLQPRTTRNFRERNRFSMETTQRTAFVPTGYIGPNPWRN